VRALIGSEGTDQLTSIEVMAFVDGQFEDGVFVPKFPDNTPPVATPDSAVVPEDSQVEINVLADDNDPDGDPISIVAIGNPSHGTVKLLSGGSVLYVPLANFHGTDSFSYRIADDKHGKTCGAVTVTPQPVIELGRYLVGEAGLYVCEVVSTARSRAARCSWSALAACITTSRHPGTSGR